MDGDIGGLGGGRRADLVLIDDDLTVHNTWYGGELVVEDRKITPVLDAALSRPLPAIRRRRYSTVKIKDTLKLTPDLPARKVVAQRHRHRASRHRAAAQANRDRAGERLVDDPGPIRSHASSR